MMSDRGGIYEIAIAVMNMIDNGEGVLHTI